MNYEKKYKQALEIAKEVYHDHRKDRYWRDWLPELFPELKESEDERIRKDLIQLISCMHDADRRKKDWLAWLENQAEKKPNPYSGTSFEYNGHIWGMCARDNGIDILLDKQLFKHLEKQDEPEDNGEISDGYHTFNELYRYRMLYNAAFFNMLPKHLVHKSKRHHDGEECFGGGWFIVMANLPTGQISNHYELKDWDLFQIPEKEIADEWDGHTPQEAAERLHKYLLEKQSINKIELKFHEGDWVVFNNQPEKGSIYQVEKIKNFQYTLRHILGASIPFSFNKENMLRYWTIQDAKNGDVLVDKDNNIGLYSGEKDDLYWHSYIYLGCDDYLRGGVGYHKHKNTKPATKEQRDLLFSKMKEAGYEWNAEKKEPKKIEDKTLEMRGNQVTSEIIKNQKEMPSEFTELVHANFWDLIKTEHKMLDADKVIEWFEPNIRQFTAFSDMYINKLIEKFKKDFGL